MSGIRHTPGPYKVFGRSVKAITHGRWFTVAVVFNKLFTPEGNAANARLVAASPVMLELIETVALGNTDADRLAEMARDVLKGLEP